MNKYDHIIKVVLVGDSDVGKSNIVTRFTYDKFESNFITTIGVDLLVKTVEVDGKRIKVQIWDTAGQERFRTITKTYYRNSDCVMVVYDTTNYESFKNAQKWIHDMSDSVDNRTYKILVGNKIDITTNTSVNKEQAKEMALENNMDACEVSAKDGTGIDGMFNDIVKNCIKKIITYKHTTDKKIMPDHDKKKGSKCCS